jgi:hypothetical protein
VGPEEAAFFVHELLVRTPAAGAALVWLDARHQLLDLFAVVCGDHEVEGVAATVLRARGRRSPGSSSGRGWLTAPEPIPPTLVRSSGGGRSGRSSTAPTSSSSTGSSSARR